MRLMLLELSLQIIAVSFELKVLMYKVNSFPGVFLKTKALRALHNFLLVFFKLILLCQIDVNLSRV